MTKREWQQEIRDTYQHASKKQMIDTIVRLRTQQMENIRNSEFGRPDDGWDEEE